MRRILRISLTLLAVVSIGAILAVRMHTYYLEKRESEESRGEIVAVVTKKSVTTVVDTKKKTTLPVIRYAMPAILAQPVGLPSPPVTPPMSDQPLLPVPPPPGSIESFPPPVDGLLQMAMPKLHEDPQIDPPPPPQPTFSPNSVVPESAPPWIRPEASVKLKTPDSPLTIALRDNADLRAVQAKVQTALAEMERTRQIVEHRAKQALAEIDIRKAEVSLFENNLTRIRQLIAGKVVGAEEEIIAEQRVAESQELLKKAEAELSSISGQSTAPAGVDKANPVEGLPSAPKTSQIEPRVLDLLIGDMLHGLRSKEIVTIAAGSEPQPGVLRQWLDKRVTLQLEPSELTPLAMLDSFLKENPVQDKDGRSLLPQLPIISMVVDSQSDGALTRKVHLEESIPIGAALQWFEDRFAWRFLVREYGIVLVASDRMPAGALTLQDYWKRR